MYKGNRKRKGPGPAVSQLIVTPTYAERPPEFPAGDAPEWTRTTTPVRAQALNLLRMPIPPPGQTG